MKKILIKNLASLATPLGSTPRGGKAMNEILELQHPCVVLEDGRIERVLTEEEAGGLDEASFEVIDGRGMTLLPGFVDPHTHLVFGGTREEEFSMRMKGATYMEIMNAGGGIASTMQKTREATEAELKKSAKKRLEGMVRHGVTSLEAKSGYGMEKETELKQLRVVKALQEETPLTIVSTFMGAHAVPGEWKGRGRAFLDHLLEEVLPVVKAEGLATFCDIFCEKGVFSIEESRHYLTRCREAGFGLKIHADEIHDLGGAALAAELGMQSADHLLQAADAGLMAMQAAGVIPVLLPLTAFSLKEEYARAREMIDMGMPVALGTDFNPGSSYSYSVPLMLALACIYMRMTPEEALTAVTLNSACALGLGDRAGTIEAGKDADLVLIDAVSYRFLPYHFGVNQVAMTMKKGEIIYLRN